MIAGRVTRFGRRRADRHGHRHGGWHGAPNLSERQVVHVNVIGADRHVEHKANPFRERHTIADRLEQGIRRNLDVRDQLIVLQDDEKRIFALVRNLWTSSVSAQFVGTFRHTQSVKDCFQTVVHVLHGMAGASSQRW